MARAHVAISCVVLSAAVLMGACSSESSPDAKARGKNVLVSPDLRLSVEPTAGGPGTVVAVRVEGCNDPTGKNHAVSFNNNSTDPSARHDPNLVHAVRTRQTDQTLTGSYTIRSSDRTGGIGRFFVQCGGSGESQPFTFMPGEVITLEASGSDAAVCTAAIAAHDVNGSGWTGTPIANGPAYESSVTWLFCLGEPGSGVGLVSARSEDHAHWETRQLPVGPRNHGGDDVQASIPDERRAWVTTDSLVGDFHRHVWTRDAGETWNVEERGP